MSTTSPADDINLRLATPRAKRPERMSPPQAMAFITTSIRKQGLREFGRATGISPGSVHNYVHKRNLSEWNLEHFDWVLSHLGYTVQVVPLPKRAPVGAQKGSPQ